MISPPQLNQLFEEMDVKSDAICYTYSRKGNIFYVMIFPTENKTYVLNLATNFIHQWASGVRQNRHRSNCYESFNGKDLVGDYINGKSFANMSAWAELLSANVGTIFDLMDGSSTNSRLRFDVTAGRVQLAEVRARRDLLLRQA